MTTTRAHAGESAVEGVPLPSGASLVAARWIEPGHDDVIEGEELDELARRIASDDVVQWIRDVVRDAGAGTYNGDGTVDVTVHADVATPDGVRCEEFRADLTFVGYGSSLSESDDSIPGCDPHARVRSHRRRFDDDDDLEPAEPVDPFEGWRDRVDVAPALDEHEWHRDRDSDECDYACGRCGLKLKLEWRIGGRVRECEDLVRAEVID